MVRQLNVFSTAIRVDIQPTTPDIPRIHRQFLRFEQALQVEKDPFHALLMEIGMLAEADDIGQQAGRVQGSAAIFHRHAAPVWLAGHRAVGFEQVAVQALLDDA